MNETTSAAFDYIIVGAGSAGCVLADRLSEDGRHTVLLLEAGGSDRNLFVHMPTALYIPMNDANLDWGYTSEPEPNLSGRRIGCPRGKLLGGSSSVNGMVYVRGHARDFDRWATLGADGWGYADVLPYFKKAQGFAGTANSYQGIDGPLAVTNGTRANPLYTAFIAGCQQAGYAASDDLNGFQQEAFGALPMTVDQGVRASTAHAYLKRARRRKNLTVLTKHRTERIHIHNNKAVGLDARNLTNNKTCAFTARKEVLLTAGAINTPQLLLLSGVGDRTDLSAQEIDCVHHLPGVGRNLMDHLEVYLQNACRTNVSLHKWTGLLGKALIGARWVLDRKGLGATNHFETGGFVRSAAGVPWPDIQFHFLPTAMSYDGSSMAGEPGFQVHVGPMLSPSRGSVSLRSRDPAAAPRIAFNYMSDASDWQVFRTAIRLGREIFQQPAFAPYRGRELSPGADVTSDHALDAFIRENAESAYHPCGTCRMGHDADAVVDTEGRVHGISGLRIADASIFPHITNGNLNAPTIMAAEKIADQIQGRQLAPEQLKFYEDAQWRSRQRPQVPTQGIGMLG